MPTTSSSTSVTTGTSLKTMLQVKSSATKPFQVVSYTISFDGSAAATPIKVELLETDVAATVTASTANDIMKIDGEALAGGDPTTNLIPVGTTSTGYTSTSEGTITATRVFDVQFVAPTNQYTMYFPLGNEPVVQVSKFLRIRVLAGAAVNCYCGVTIRV